MMLVSKRIFATTLILIFCDVTLAASASNIDNYAMLSPRKEKEAEFVVEYYKDHEISEKQARENLRNMRDDDFITPAHCKACKAEHRKYCHSENLLKDHCCCNQSHNKEQLYFIPHTCFINEDRCSPSLGSCLTVIEIRKCCCDAQLKRQWRSLLSGANVSRSSKYFLLALLVAVFVQ